MKILIIGGTGFIGPYLLDRLVGDGHRVTVFHRGQSHARLPSQVDRVLGNRDELEQHRNDFERIRPDVVVHMIAFTTDHGREFMRTFRGIAGRVVVASSIDVYRAFGRLHRTEPGPPDPVPLSEEAELRRQPSIHGENYEKRWVEDKVMSDRVLPGTILRLPAVHGPGDPFHRVYKPLKRMDDGRRVILLGQDQATWRFSRGYVENVAAAIAIAVSDDRATNRIYNVADRPVLSQAEWIQGIGRAAGWDGELRLVPEDELPEHLKAEEDLRQDWIVDTTRIRTELGYDDLVSLDEGLLRTVAWERANAPENIPKAEYDYEAEDRVLAEIEESRSQD